MEKICLAHRNKTCIYILQKEESNSYANLVTEKKAPAFGRVAQDSAALNKRHSENITSTPMLAAIHEVTQKFSEKRKTTVFEQRQFSGDSMGFPQRSISYVSVEDSYSGIRVTPEESFQCVSQYQFPSTKSIESKTSKSPFTSLNKVLLNPNFPQKPAIMTSPSKLSIFNTSSLNVRAEPFHSCKSVEVEPVDRSRKGSNEMYLFPENIADLGIQLQGYKNDPPSENHEEESRTVNIQSRKSSGQAQLEEEHRIGIVKFFDQKKKFGFLEVNGEPPFDVFFHYEDFKYSALSLRDIKELRRTKKQVKFRILRYSGKQENSIKAVDFLIENEVNSE